MTDHIDRSSAFWTGCFHIALASLCKRDPELVMQGPRCAHIARDLADDCDRARRDAEQNAKCAACAGIGCPACHYSGTQDGAALRAPTLSIEEIEKRLRRRQPAPEAVSVPIPLQPLEK